MSRFAQFIFFCGLLFCSLAVRAAEDEESVYVEFQVYLWPEQISMFIEDSARRPLSDGGNGFSGSATNASTYQARPIYYKGGGEHSLKLELAEGQLSSWCKYTGTPIMEFYLDDPDKAIENARACASIKLPSDAQKVIIVLFLETKYTYKALPIVLPRKPLKMGEDIIYNLSTTPLICTMGAGKFNIDPGTYVVNEPKTLEEYFQVIVVAAKADSGKLRRLAVRKFPRMEDRNTLFFLYNRPGAGNGVDLARIMLTAAATSGKVPSAK